MCFDPVHSLEVNTFSGLKQKSVYLNCRNQVLAQQVGPYLLEVELEAPPLKRNYLQKLFGLYCSQGQVKNETRVFAAAPAQPRLPKRNKKNQQTPAFRAILRCFSWAGVVRRNPPVHARTFRPSFSRSRALAHVCLADSEDNTLTQVILLQSCLGQNLQTQRLLLSKQDLFLPVTSFRDEGKDFPQPTAFSVQTLPHNILKLQKS